MTALKLPTQACPLPIATTQFARALLRLHSRLRGELAKGHDDEELMVDAEAARAMMLHAEALIGFLGIRFEPKELKPIRTRPHTGPLGYGELRAEILAVLRAQGDWLTYAEICEGIIARQSLELEPKQKRQFLQKLREAAHQLAKSGAVERERDLHLGQHATLQRWRLSRRLFRPR
jgi:hypothetical protein